MECPWCLEEDSSVSMKNWYYVGYKVSRHVCSKCGEKYNTYEENGKIRFTVPKKIDIP